MATVANLQPKKNNKNNLQLEHEPELEKTRTRHLKKPTQTGRTNSKAKSIATFSKMSITLKPQKKKLSEQSSGCMHHTAAIEGTSDRPGDPCETSIPKIIVGVLETNGIVGESSMCSKEFIPPSCHGKIHQ